MPWSCNPSGSPIDSQPTRSCSLRGAGRRRPNKPLSWGRNNHNASTGKTYWTGQRVELNAMTSDQFVAWLERRLTEHGVTKIIPSPETLAKTYRLAVRTKAINAQLAHLQETLRGHTMDIPADLATRVGAALQASPQLSWEAAIWKLVRGHEADV